MRTLKILLVAGSLLATLTSAHAADKSLTIAKADLAAAICDRLAALFAGRSR